MGSGDSISTRRDVLALAAIAAAAAMAPGAAKAAESVSTPWRSLRRLVTTEGPDGKGRVLADGEPSNSFMMNGTRITRLWESGAVPAPLPATEDLGATAGNAYRKGFRGTSFYVAEIPAGTGESDIPMHRQDTLDYLAVLSGRIVLKIEGSEIELGAGDTVVQSGNLHTWINRWPEPCALLFVVVAGVRM
jgi:mannose-6-phosphate isomerase-like protein (cupin superfamily)